MGGVAMTRTFSDEARQRMREAALSRSPESEEKRLKAIRSESARKKMSDSKKGKKPNNFHEAQRKAWEANRKDVLTYSGIHAWVKRTWGKANHCELCGKVNLRGRKVHWANKDHQYSRERSDWFMACRSCHAEHDKTKNGVIFSTKGALVTHCPQGHEYTQENTNVYKGSRSCKTCARNRAREKRRLET
jgi:hypothetical protein